jgi:hypothetical protein
LQKELAKANKMQEQVQERKKEDSSTFKSILSMFGFGEKSKEEEIRFEQELSSKLKTLHDPEAVQLVKDLKSDIEQEKMERK